MALFPRHCQRLSGSAPSLAAALLMFLLVVLLRRALSPPAFAAHSPDRSFEAAGAALAGSGACPVYASLAFGPPPPPPPLGGYLVIIRVAGLGNQLFQVAAGVRQAIASNRTPLLGPAYNPHATVPYEPTVFRRLCVAPAGLEAPSLTLAEEPEALWAYRSPVPLPPAAKAAVVAMTGTWQHWRLVEELPAAALRELFAPPPGLAARLERAYGPLDTCVALHVRRGDYLDIENAAGVDMGYFEVALRRVEAAVGAPFPCLLIASNDIAWARAQPGFTRRGARFIEGEDEVATLYLLLAAGRGLICPNSTFCWWAAFLGRYDNDGALRRGRMVTMPKPFFSRPSIADEALPFPGVDTIDRADWLPGQEEPKFWAWASAWTWRRA